MNRHRWLQLLGALLLSTLLVSAAVAPTAAAAPGPQAAATAYLQARGAAITAPQAGAALAPWVAPGTSLAATEALIARGTARRAAQLGHLIDDVRTQVAITAVSDGDDSAATVGAHVITTIDWHAASGAATTEASGVDHTLSLRRSGGVWQVAADAYTDTQTPAYLEAGGAPIASVRAATVRLERSAPRLTPPSAAAGSVKPAARYADIITYDRQDATDYANKYALSYNPTYVRFSADCADFCSQSARGGSMPMAPGGADSGWWYDRQGTSASGNDTYSLSWINVARQMSYWNTRRTDWASSISDVGKGDFVYYDWTGDGVWDHVAVLVGANSAGQKIVDAHTTDHYHVFWKLGTASTHYKFARTRASWVIS